MWMTAVGRGGGVVVVRDHHGRLAEHDGGVAQELEHLVAGLESRLPVGSSANSTVGSDTSARATATRCCWPPDSSDGRWLVRSASPTRSTTASYQSCVDLAAGELQRQEDVLLGRQRRQQVERLEDEADVRAAQLGELRVVHLRDVLAGDVDAAGGRLVEPGQDVHQRGLAGPRGAHDRGELAARDVDA